MVVQIMLLEGIFSKINQFIANKLGYLPGAVGMWGLRTTPPP